MGCQATSFAALRRRPFDAPRLMIEVCFCDIRELGFEVATFRGPKWGSNVAETNLNG